MNEITNNHDNELTERKDPIVPLVLAVGAAGAVGVDALVHKYRRKRGKK